MKVTSFELAVESVGADVAVPRDAARNCVITGMAVGRDSSVGIATRYGVDGPGLEFWRGTRFSAFVQTGLGGPPGILYNGYRVKRPGRGADHPHTPLVPRPKKDKSCPSIAPLGHRGLLWGDIYLYLNGCGQPSKAWVGVLRHL